MPPLTLALIRLLGESFAVEGGFEQRSNYIPEGDYRLLGRGNTSLYSVLLINRPSVLQEWR